MKKLLALLTIFVALGALSACGGNDADDDSNGGEGDRERTEESTDDEDLREFTLDELSEYDGKDGNDAYAAVDGYVYDMTDSSYWNEGNHQNRVEAGQDLTDEIDMDSPHGREALDNVPKIGILVD
ncbi:MAG: cytochrome b5 domain-containing protein [Candidatus Izemoplasmataceae bacterium]